MNQLLKFECVKPRLIILSDLWGLHDSFWVKDYVTILKQDFDVKVYDSCSLAELNITERSESKIHKQFVDKGIEIASRNLIKTETKKISVLGFSVGGTIAWSAALKGLDIETLYAISSTRLRYETKSPDCKIELYFGEKDQHKPNQDWFTQMELDQKLIMNKSHTMYVEPKIVKKISTDIIKGNRYQSFK